MVVSHDPRTCKHVCVQLRTSGINVALPAFAAARRAASAPAVQQSIARLAHSSNTTARCCSRRMGQTDRRTLYLYIDPAPHTMQAVSENGGLKPDADGWTGRRTRPTALLSRRCPLANAAENQLLSKRSPSIHNLHLSESARTGQWPFAARSIDNEREGAKLGRNRVL